MRRIKLYSIGLAMLFLLAGCGQGGTGNPQGATVPASGPEESETLPESGSSSEGGLSMVSQDSGTDFQAYQAPEFADAVFHADKAEEKGTVKVDLSALSQGYVAVSATSDKRLKLQVIKKVPGSDDIKYNYDVPSDGTPMVAPIQCGDGTYQFSVLENISGTKYAYLYDTEREVTLQDEFQPFLRPNDHVNYSKDSECVRKVAELAAREENALGVVSAVYDYITQNVKYDKEKAALVQTDAMAGYLPDPDEILSSGKGICMDYAALTAAMLRSQGIPTKVVFGFVSPDDIYHAWNMFYTEETGWVTVKFQVSADSWNRLDLTFSAGGAGSSFVGDGSNYTDSKYY